MKTAKIAFAVLAACGAASISGCGSSSSDPAPSAAATGQPSLEADLAAIAAFNERYLGAINDEDLAALSSLTTEGHVMLPPNRAPIVGKAANDEANGRAFAQFDIDETWTPIETVVSGDLAFQRGTYTTSARPKNGGTRSSAPGGTPSSAPGGAPSSAPGGAPSSTQGEAPSTNQGEAASASETEGAGNQAAAAPAPAREIRGSFLRIYQRQPNGEWRMTRDMFNTESAQAAQAAQP